MTRYEQEYYADIKNQTRLLERIAASLEELVKKEDTDQPGQAGVGFDVDMRNRNNEFLDQSEPEELLPEVIIALATTGLTITGECLGEPNIHSGPEFEKYLREILEISLNEDDFVRKSVMGITDENNDIQAIDKEKLRTFYWKEKGKIGYLETTKQKDKSIPVITADEDLQPLSETIIGRFKDGEFKTKKQAILAYVDTFGLDGARYTDIIKFAYELSHGVGKFQPTTDRGYYSCAFSPRYGGHLVRGGEDYLIQPFNYTYYSNEYVRKVGMDVIEFYLNGDVNP